MAKKTATTTGGSVNLTLFKRTVEALEAAIASAEKIKEGDKIEYILELDKVLGYLSGIIGETGMLIGDVQHLIQKSSAPAASKVDIDQILGGFKSGGAN
jgi:hypothetical protein